MDLGTRRMGAAGIAAAIAGSVVLAGCSLSPGIPCTQGCPQDTFCDPATGLCAVAGIRIVAPAVNEPVGATVRMAAELRSRGAADGGPDSLSFEISVSGPGGAPIVSGTLARSGAQYTGTWSPPQEGFYDLRVSDPASGTASDPVGFRVDLTQPQLSVETAGVPQRQGVMGVTFTDVDPDLLGAWRRDERVPLIVTSSSQDLDPATVTVTLEGTSGQQTPPAPVAASCDAGPFCGHADVDLAGAEFGAYHGIIDVVARAKDRAGNSQMTRLHLSVTRFRWRLGLQPPGAVPVQPAIGAGGVVYAASGAVQGQAALSAVSPAGQLLWNRRIDGLAGGIAIGSNPASSGELLFVTTDVSDAGYLVSVDAADGGSKALCGPFRDGMSEAVAVTRALLPGQLDLTQSVVASAGANGGLLIAAMQDGTCVLSPTRIGFPGSSGISMDAERAYFSYRSPVKATTRFDLTSASWQQGASWPMPGVFSSTWVPRSGGLLLGAGSIGSDGGAFQISASGPQGGVQGVTSVPAAEAYDLAFDGANAYFGASSGAFYSAMPPSPFSPQTPSAVSVAPAIGSDGTIYTVEGGGAVSAGGEWTYALDGGSAPLKAPALDCARSSGVADPSRPGTLYVQAADGFLWAFVADSRGLSTAAGAWPKLRHDARNTGEIHQPLGCP